MHAVASVILPRPSNLLRYTREAVMLLSGQVARVVLVQKIYSSADGSTRGRGGVLPRTVEDDGGLYFGRSSALVPYDGIKLAIKQKCLLS